MRREMLAVIFRFVYGTHRGGRRVVAARKRRGTSGLHRAGCRITSCRGNSKESATETYRRGFGEAQADEIRGKGEIVR